jgi:hypothetical protein
MGRSDSENDFRHGRFASLEYAAAAFRPRMRVTSAAQHRDEDARLIKRHELRKKEIPPRVTVSDRYAPQKPRTSLSHAQGYAGS